MGISIIKVTTMVLPTNMVGISIELKAIWVWNDVLDIKVENFAKINIIYKYALRKEICKLTIKFTTNF